MTTVSRVLELELERHCTSGARVEVGTRYPWWGNGDDDGESCTGTRTRATLHAWR